MQKLLDALPLLKKTNSKLSNTSIINLQQQLKHQNFGLLPLEFAKLLYIYNGLSYNDGVICGIFEENNFQDISSLNKAISHPLHKDLIFLGYDSFDYLAYNQKHQIYQIIDKSDLEVLEEYSDLSNAIQHILKIDYE